MPTAHCQWTDGRPVDMLATLSLLRHGPGDPTFVTADGLWRTTRTPDGPATLQLVSDGTVVHARAWGLGAGWAVEAAPDLLGAGDDDRGFVAHHRVVRDIARRRPGMRIGRTGLAFESLVPAILEQQVTSVEAHRAWRRLLQRYGEPAPGPAPAGMRVSPAPETWARIPSWEWHRAGVDGRRARAVVTAARVARRIDETAALDRREAVARLRSLPGVGQWTAAEVAQRAFGDVDAVSVGDYNLPSLIGWTLIGERVDDDRMLELLEPYRPQRYRAVKLIELGGRRAPRRAPRAPIRDFARI